MTGIYRIGGAIIRFESMYDLVHLYCAKYRAEGEPELVVTIRQEDLDREREYAVRSAAAEGREPFDSPDDYLEELAVYRKIAEWMPSRDTFLFHGSAIAVDGQCYLFTAKSGTGKSTHTRLWREMLGDRAVMVNDDKPLIHVGADGSAIVYGTPWNGKHRLGTNTEVPLRAVCILERSPDNRITKITRSEILPMLIQQSYRPSDPAALTKTVNLISRLQADFWRLGCNMNPDAAELSYNAMKP